MTGTVVSTTRTTPPGATADPAGRRTRLSPEREAELYDRTLGLVGAEGYDSLTMDTIAAATRSSKATLYRQWGSKERLVAAAMRHNKERLVADIDTGSLRGDLREMSHRYAAASDHDGPMVLYCALADAGRRHPELAEAIEAEIVAPGRNVLGEFVRRATDRGELDPERAGADFLQHMLAGAILARTMTERCAPDLEYMLRYIDAVVLPALGIPVDASTD